MPSPFKRAAALQINSLSRLSATEPIQMILVFDFSERWTKIPAPLMAMPSQSGIKLSEIFTAARGMYERVARKLNVSASLVSLVASRKRVSSEIEAALRQEWAHLKEKLDTYDRENPGPATEGKKRRME